MTPDDAERPIISVIMVTYNSEAHVGRALAALRTGARATTIEVLVVDNSSVDRSKEAALSSYPQATLISSQQNLGFAAACNLAARQACGEYLLFLNPDSQIDHDSIDIAKDYIANHSEVGMVGGRTRYPNGELNLTCCFAEPSLWSAFCYATGLTSLFRRSAILNPEAMGIWDRSTDREVDVITGCFALIRASLFQSLGGFDERFFLYSEDTDLSRRVRERGLKCVHLGAVGLIHIGGGSDHIRSEKLVKVITARNQYYRKHWSARRARSAMLLMEVGVLSRRLASLIGPAQRRETWSEIWQSRDRWRNLAENQNARMS